MNNLMGAVKVVGCTDNTRAGCRAGTTSHRLMYYAAVTNLSFARRGL